MNIRKVATLPAGPYVVGDPCYMIDDAAWIDWLNDADFTIQSREHVLLANYRGQPAVGVGTAHGDGCYYDQDGREYGVDAGLIGAVPVSVLTAEQLADYDTITIVHFDRDFDCYFEDGVVHIGHVMIDTDWEPEDEDDYQDEDEDEDY